jgi:membrane-associated protease RseP (regulator of RpoE activity)
VTSPAAAAGLRAGDRVVAIGELRDPTDDELVCATRAHVGEPADMTIARGDQTFHVAVVPVLGRVPSELLDDCPGLTPVDGKVGRIGVVLGLAREPAGVLGALAGGARLVWDSGIQTIGNIGRIFGPEGIGRMAELLFTDAPREPTDPVSVVGIGQVASQTASGGNAGDLLYLFALVNVFIGLLNLLPLPPFDGGHLAVLAIEKVRGRQVDMRKVVPVSVAVAAFFIVFTVSIIYLDLVKPGSLAP